MRQSIEFFRAPGPVTMAEASPGVGLAPSTDHVDIRRATPKTPEGIGPFLRGAPRVKLKN